MGDSTYTINIPRTPAIEITSSPYNLSVNTRYIVNMASLTTLVLPATAAQGDQIMVRGKGAGGWVIAQNSGQTIHGASDTTTGTSGSIGSQTFRDTVTLECTTANTDFTIIGGRGTLTIV